MSSDEEILCRGNDLYSHLVNEGCHDFETFEHSNSLRTNIEPILINTQVEKKNVDITQLSSHDHDMLITILNSKLLFMEDVEMIESLLSNVHISQKGFNFYMLSSIVTASSISLLVCLKKGMNICFPLCLTALFSFHSIWHCYKGFKENCQHKLLLLHIGSLQKLCLNIHKLLRFLKETEILSTGQVSTYNVGAAMYIPVSNVKELDKIPSWKTLPHLRNCLADALLNVINILCEACDSVTHLSPTWMSIRGFTFSKGNLFQDNLKSLENVSDYDRCISIKSLQQLNDNYLVIQSEYLRWVAFCICPVVWTNSLQSMYSCRLQMFKLFEGMQSKLSELSLKIKMQYNIQHIFSMIKPIYEQSELGTRFRDIKSIHVEVHSIFVLILHSLIKIRSLEDELENILFDDKNIDSNSLKINLNKQLKTVREDLEATVKGYDNIYYHAINKKKPEICLPDSTGADGMPEFRKPEPTATEINVSVSDINICSPDEVFLATSGLNSDEPESCMDDWCLERKAQIPKTLLTELSTTLKPIKKDFEERERLALERIGLQDIKNVMDSENDEDSDNEILITKPTSSDLKANDRLLQKNISKHSNKQKGIKEEDSISLKNEVDQIELHSHLLSEADIHLSSNDKKSVENIDPETRSPIIDDSTLANIIAMKSKSWGKIEEEYYSDD